MSYSPIDDYRRRNDDDVRICDVLTTVRDTMVSQLVAQDLGETDAATMWARRVDATVRAWLSADDLVRAVQLLLSEESRQIAGRIATGVALVAPQTGTAVVTAAVNDTRGAGSHLPGACSATPGAAHTAPGVCPNHHDEKGAER